MTTVLVISIFLLVLVGGFATFLLLEAYALSKKDDEFHTLSTYIKRARRKHEFLGQVVLTLAIFGPAIWLWGHLAKEWW